ncbi:MAG: radical SAM protein [Candidatus Omnitrophota bacterium]
MKVCFVAKEAESLGIECLSSFLKQNGHEVYLVYDPALFDDTIFRFGRFKKFFSYTAEAIELICRGNPDVICFSVLSDTLEWAYNVARKIKQRSQAPIIFGGIHPTSVPEIVLENTDVDFVIMGEGEYPLLELVNALADGSENLSIPNVCYRKNGQLVKNEVRPFIVDLDKLPFPDKDLFYDALPNIKKHYTIITSRGCFYDCTYCYASAIEELYRNKGKKVRRRSVENVIAELIWAKDKYAIKDVLFDDEIFTFDPQWLKQFASAYKREIGLPCFLWVHPNMVTEEVVGYLKSMNCYAVEMGVQSASQALREKILNRFYSNQKVKDAIAMLKRNKISCIVDNIVGLPRETLTDVEDLVRFFNETRPDKIYVFYLRYFPRTKIIDIANLDASLIRDIERNKAALPFTLQGNSLLLEKIKVINKLLFTLLLSYILPRKIIGGILNKKIYRYFPAFNPYNLLETIPFVIGFFARPFKKILPNREYRTRYPYYILRKFNNKVKFF